MQNTTVEPFMLIGIAVRTSNQDGNAAKDIPALWQRFMGEGIREKIPHKLDSAIYSLYTEYDGDHNLPYTTMLGCRVSTLDELPAGMVGKTFDGGEYVQLSAKGNLAQGLIYNKWLEIWNMDLDRAYTADFEVYGEKAQNPDDAEVDIYIALK